MTFEAATLKIEPFSENEPLACGLPSSSDDFDIDEQSSPGSVSELTAIQGQQLITTAQWSAGLVHSSKKIATVLDALNYFKSTTSSELYVQDVSFDGQEWKVVVALPSDETQGLIFKKGSTQVVGKIADTEISCASKP